MPTLLNTLNPMPNNFGTLTIGIQVGFGRIPNLNRGLGHWNPLQL
jgi:hypothetical protein